MFHTSLLRIHIPKSADDADGEWTVDRILSHAGSGADTLFEIWWKTGDVTWLPYYQVTHLHALTDYLDLLHIQQISKLPWGDGWPPSDDPQIFVSPMALNFPIPNTMSFPFLLSILLYLTTSIHLILLTPQYLTSLFSTLLFPIPHFFSMPQPHSIKHPCFSQVSNTYYLIKTPIMPCQTPSMLVKSLSFSGLMSNFGPRGSPTSALYH